MTEAQQLFEEIKEEKWTRSALTSYTSNTFANLNSIIRSAKKNGNLEVIRQLCSDHLTHTPNSIIASYVMGKLNYEEGNLNYGYLEQLIDIFMKNRKFGVAEFLAKEILKYTENITALNTIAECMTNTGRENDVVKIWERLVKIDSEESDLAKKVAELKEEGGNKEEAVLYYKKALFRYLIEKAIPSNQRKINKTKNTKENEEYTYAFKKQKILEKEAEALKVNLSKAQVLNPRKIKTNTVSVGTTVTLDNIYDHKTEKFTILGPWELDPSKKIISYTSPTGKSLLNHSPGDIVTMEPKKNGKKYKIRKIEQAVF